MNDKIKIQKIEIDTCKKNGNLITKDCCETCENFDGFVDNGKEVNCNYSKKIKLGLEPVLLGFSSTANFAIATDLTYSFLSSSIIFANKAEKIEKQFTSSSTIEESTKYEHMGYILHCLVFSVAALESYIYMLIWKNNLEEKIDKEKPYLTDKVEILNSYFKPSSKMILSTEMKNIMYLRNQYIHYDHEAVDSDTHLMSNPSEKDKMLQRVLCYFKELINKKVIEENKLIDDSFTLFVRKILSSSLAKWCIKNTIKQIKEIDKICNSENFVFPNYP